jgi:choline dehydrogenase-like flavoprotein
MNSYFTSGSKLPESPYPPYYASAQDDKRTPDKIAAPRYTSMMQFNWPNFSTHGTQKWRDQIKDVFNKYSHVTADPDSELPLLSTYERIVGGTTWHWLGTCLRLVPSDFQTQSLFGYGTDWPLQYDDLRDDYGLAEHLIGVSADVSEQHYLHIDFPAGYSYPMGPVASSYSDLQLNSMMQGLVLDFDGEQLSPSVNNTPQGRVSSGLRDGRPSCQGNNSCIPICPIRAKFDATVVLSAARAMLDPAGRPYVELWSQSVAFNLNLDASAKLVTSVDVKTYDKETGGTFKQQTVSAPIIVVAAHAIETARLLLNSNGTLKAGVANSSDQVGRNLMDHIVYLSWGLSPTNKPLYPFRGPRSSSGIESLRDGKFRRKHSAFRVDIGNEGWGWADGDPATIVGDFLTGKNDSLTNPHNLADLFGSELVSTLNGLITRMMRFCFLVEQEPDRANQVTVNPSYVDGLNIPRANTYYTASPYTKRGIKKAVETSEAIFQYAGITPYTQFHDDYTAVEYDSSDPKNPKSCNVFGAGHIMGTYRMGTDPKSSVVNADQQSHDHPNLFLLGSGTFPTVGTANPTLTVAALAFRASRAVLKQLGKLH